MVLRRRQHHHFCAVGDCHDREFFAEQKFLDDDNIAGAAKLSIAEHALHGGARASARVSQTTAPLPAASPDALTTSGSGC